MLISNNNYNKLKELPIYKRVGFGINDGWTKLIYTLGVNIMMYCKLHKQELPRILQIKEKFGSLRFYYTDNNDSYIRQLVRDAEAISEKICEQCGSPGEMRCDDGRWFTSCQEHATKTSILAEEWQYIQQQKILYSTNCDVCGQNMAKKYKDPSLNSLVTRCDRHVDSYLELL